MWIKEFIDCLEGATLEHPRLEEAIALKEPHLPKRIYKYRRDSTNSRENLKSDTVRMASPDTYNDPYDCSFTVAEEEVDATLKMNLLSEFAKDYKLQSDEAKTEIDKALNSGTDPLASLASSVAALKGVSAGSNPQQMAKFVALMAPKLIADTIGVLRQWRKITKVCSFSAVNNSILMWGHYAQDHEGFCIEYDIENLKHDHARAVASYLTGVRPKKTLGADLHSGISADQIAAHALGSKTRLGSLEMTCESTRTVGECDSYSCAYQTLSYRSETEPLAPEMNPRVIFERMFGDIDISESPQERRNEMLFRTSVLDLTMESVRDIQRKLGSSDRQKLDEYFTCIRDLETRLAKAEAEPQAELPTGATKPAGVPSDFSEHAQLMFGLIKLAFQTDTTRVITFMLAREGGLRPYPEIGVPEAHHSISHHGNDPVLIEKLAKIETYHMEQFAKFVDDLKTTTDAGGTMLDGCLLVYGAGLADPNVHDHDHCPTLLVGNAGSSIRMGRHIDFKPGTPISNLHLTMLDAIGVPTETLGNSEGKLDFLTGV